MRVRKYTVQQVDQLKHINSLIISNLSKNNQDQVKQLLEQKKLIEKAVQTQIQMPQNNFIYEQSIEEEVEEVDEQDF